MLLNSLAAMWLCGHYFDLPYFIRIEHTKASGKIKVFWNCILEPFFFLVSLCRIVFSNRLIKCILAFLQFFLTKFPRENGDIGNEISSLSNDFPAIISSIGFSFLLHPKDKFLKICTPYHLFCSFFNYSEILLLYKLINVNTSRLM